jgi:hypothetical protein
MGDWAKDKKPIWDNICDKYGGNKEAFEWGTWGFFDWAIGKAWPTLLSISKARKYGWKRYDDTFDTWVETFKTFENTGILPAHHALRAHAVTVNLDKQQIGLTNGAQPETEAPSIVAT